MTTPLGDLPDWQTLVTPQIQAASIVNQTGGLTGTILQSGSPFRVWGLWITTLFSSNASYVAALNNIFSQIIDGANNVLFEVDLNLRVANTAQHEALSIAVPGWTPANFGGSFGIFLKTASSPANTDYRASGGIYFSQP